MAIIVFVPVLLNPDLLRTNPANAYHPIKFRVLVWLSAALLVAMLGFVTLRRKPLVLPVLIPSLAFLGISAVSTLLSEDPVHSLFGDRDEGLLSIAAGVLLFYATARSLNSLIRVRAFLAAGVTTAFLISVYGISQNYGFDPISGWWVQWYTDLGRPFATVGNPVTLASYLTLMAGGAAALYFMAGSPLWRVLWLLALAVISACWIYTDTRGAMLGVVAATPVILWMVHRRMGTLRPLQIPVATLMLAVTAAIMASAVFGNLSFPPYLMIFLTIYVVVVGVILWFSDLRPTVVGPLLVALAVLMVVAGTVAVMMVSNNMDLLDRTVVGRKGELSSQIRLYIWRDTVPMILERPLLGHGPDNFAEPFKAHIDEDLKAALGQAHTVDRAHNDLLEIAATTGLLGLTAYIWIFVSYFSNAYRYGGWPLAALSGALLAYILQLQLSFPSASSNVAFWSLLGSSVAIMRLQGRGDEEPVQETTKAESVQVRTETPRARAYELLVVIVVFVVLVSLALPTFLDQREKAAKAAREDLILNVSQSVYVYEQSRELQGTYPKAGVYTSRHPIKGGGGLSFRPSNNVVITTTTSENRFKVEGKSTSLSGVFKASYDSATRKYTTPS
ncbi:MAG: O-antigen ligase family protein [Actinomycetota bacterium]|nr:O-antigen ligase family protein [Actinomycetota bacterium]